MYRAPYGAYNNDHCCEGFAAWSLPGGSNHWQLSIIRNSQVHHHHYQHHHNYHPYHHNHLHHHHNHHHHHHWQLLIIRTSHHVGVHYHLMMIDGDDHGNVTDIT